MTIEVAAEKGGLRLTALVITNTTETHSAIQEVPKNEVEVVRGSIQAALYYLIERAIENRKP